MSDCIQRPTQSWLRFAMTWPDVGNISYKFISILVGTHFIQVCRNHLDIHCFSALKFGPLALVFPYYNTEGSDSNIKYSVGIQEES